MQAEQNAVGNPYIQDLLDSMEREELPLSEEELFLREMRGE